MEEIPCIRFLKGVAFASVQGLENFALFLHRRMKRILYGRVVLEFRSASGPSVDSPDRSGRAFSLIEERALRHALAFHG